MAYTIKFGEGQADATGVSISGTEWVTCYGPPSRGQGETRGRYSRQVSGSSGAFRFVCDEPTPGTASPSTYTFAPITR